LATSDRLAVISYWFHTACLFCRIVWCIWWESGQSHWLQGDGVWHFSMLSWSYGWETQV